MPDESRTRAARQKGLYRNQILQAAARVFAARGARDATVEEMLQEAQVSRRTFYRFFGNKDEVLSALYDVSCELLLDALRDALASTPDPMKSLEHVIDAYLAFNRSSGALLRVLEAEALRPGSPLERRRAELLDAVSQEITRRISETVGDRVDPLVMYGALAGIEGISYRMHTEGPISDERLSHARRAMLRILTSTVLPITDSAPQATGLPPRETYPTTDKEEMSQGRGERGACSLPRTPASRGPRGPLRG